MAKRKKQHGGRRKGAGRKPDATGAKTELVRLLLAPADAKRWRAAAERAGMTLSNLIRTAMEAYLK